jgi:hypothetical protein
VKAKVLPWNLTIDGITVHESHGKRWIGMPGRALLDEHGNTIRAENGRVAYSPVLHLDSNATRQFGAAVLGALDGMTGVSSW